MTKSHNIVQKWHKTVSLVEKSIFHQVFNMYINLWVYECTCLFCLRCRSAAHFLFSFDFPILLMFMPALCFIIEVLSYSVVLYLLGRKEFLFINSCLWESLSIWCTLKSDNGQTCLSVKMDRQHPPTHLMPTLGTFLLSWDLRW